MIDVLERLTMRAWPAVEEEEYDGWLLRAANGYTGRANSVNPFKAGSIPLAEKIAHCEDWYRGRLLPVEFRLNAVSQPPALEAYLEGRGYRRFAPTMVMTAPLPLPVNFPCPKGGAMELSRDEWFAGKNPDTRAKQAAILDRIKPMHWLMGWKVDDETVARGLGVLDGGWLGLFNLSVNEPHRRQGYGRALMQSLLARAVEHGGEHAYLQVAVENKPAVGLYAGLGFHESYRYWYRILDGVPR
jgi:GNAT superfamily N-acetyltransferase